MNLSHILAEEVAAFDQEFSGQNELTLAILGALEHRGFYDAGKYLDDTLMERIAPIFKAFLKAHDARVLSALIQELEKRKGALNRTQLFTKSYSDGHDAAIANFIDLIKSAMNV